MGRIGALIFVVWFVLITYTSIVAYVPGQYVWWIPITSWFILAIGIPSVVVIVMGLILRLFK